MDGRRLRALLAVLALSLMGTAAWGQGEGKRQCSLGYGNSIFTPQAWPERSLEAFAQGQLGIVDPLFDHFYLFIAYRRLAGKSLTAADLEQLRRFDPCWDDGSKGYHGKEWSASPVMQAARRDWDLARRSPGLPALLAPQDKAAGGRQSVMGYLEPAIPNCNPDAFRNAARTLRERLSAHGPNPWVREWVAGQDVVFEHCFATTAAMPADLQADAPPWLRADRAYQLAAAHFYAGHYAEAALRFGAIAEDAGSPWQATGRYLAARAHVRQASASSDKSAASASLAQALPLLDTALAKATEPGLRTDIARMRQRVRLQTEPDAVFAEIDARLSAANLAPGVGQDVRDFNPELAGSAAPHAGASSFAAWLHAMRKGADTGGAIASASDDAWLVALLQSAKPGDPRLPDMLERAARVLAASPAWQTVAYHRIRLLQDRSQSLALARKLLALPQADPVTQDRNRIKALALPLAQTWDEWAAMAYRAPVHVADLEPADRMVLPVVDSDGGLLLNRALPVDRLFTLYASNQTPAPLRRELLPVVWTRAHVLGRWDLLHKLLPDMQQRLPAQAALLKQIDAAADLEEKKGRGAIFLALHPGLVGSLATEISYARRQDVGELAQPNMHRFYLQDGSRANWWCSLPEGRYWRQDPIPAPPPAPALLSAREQRQWSAEYQVLTATPDATHYLGSQVLAWAKSHPRDATLPGALRMIVRSARGGCVDEDGALAGRQAFRHLHRYFPASEAARLTRSHS